VIPLSSPDPAERCVLVIGKEGTGKTQLIASLTGRLATPTNFRGATVSCETYRGRDRTYVDTPGIIRQSDSVTTRSALERLRVSETVLVVVQATHIDQDLADLLPLVTGKRVVIVATFWDKVAKAARSGQAQDGLRREAGVPIVPVDARRLSDEERNWISRALDSPPTSTRSTLGARAGWRIEPKSTWLESRSGGPPLACALLLLPGVAAVYIANAFAQLLDPLVRSGLAPVASWFLGAPAIVNVVLTGSYGLITMGPLLFVWAVPTVLIYALVLGLYKASGLLDRLTTAIHPLMRPFGLSGRDLVRVVMGFGCNVPAVVGTRACSLCSRGTCISVIAFGSACSYQFGATLAVFSSARLSRLLPVYLGYLAITTLIYARLSASSLARSPLNLLVLDRRVYLVWPSWRCVWHESRVTIHHFFQRALPIFTLITVIASVFDYLGAVRALAAAAGPLMTVFRLPREAALPVVLSSIRTDGILLLATQNVAAGMTPGQILTAVYLAGVLTPCLVTALTIAREQSPRFAVALVLRQAVAAVCFAFVLGQFCAILKL
jgi:ferrous iron transport protein B